MGICSVTWVGGGSVLRGQVSPFRFLPARPCTPAPWTFPGRSPWPPMTQVGYLALPQRGHARSGASPSPAAQLRAPGAPACSLQACSPTLAPSWACLCGWSPSPLKAPAPQLWLTSPPTQSAWVCDQGLRLEPGVLAQPPTCGVTLGKWC